MTTDYMHDRIRNWVRWCTTGLGHGHCRSLEHRYVEPSDLGRESKPSVFTDIFDAAKVEACLCDKTFPKKYRHLLINEFIKRKQYQQTCREFGIRYNLYDIELEKAINILDNRLHKKHLTANPVIATVVDNRSATGHGINTHLNGELATA